MSVIAAAVCILGALLVAIAPMMGPDAAAAMAVAQGLWLFGNALWLVIACRRRMWALASQFAVFYLLAAWGLVNWRAA